MDRSVTSLSYKIIALLTCLSMLLLACAVTAGSDSGRVEIHYHVYATSYTLTMQVQGQGTTEPTAGTHTVPVGGIIYYEDFQDDDGGYVAAGTHNNWQWGIPETWPGQAASGDRCWGTNLTGHYSDNANEVLTSPIIDLRSLPTDYTVHAQWMQAIDIESSAWDQAVAEVRINDGSWTPMWTHTGGTVRANWHPITFDISTAAGGTVQFRWSITTDSSINYNGYYIDAVTIITSLPITAVPADGWEFSHWDGDVADPVSPSTTVIMDDNKTVTAHFTDARIPVASAADLDAIRNNAIHTFAAGTPVAVTTAGGLDKHYYQVADIALGTAPWNEGTGWQPIGDSADPFTGSYDGNGFSIHGLTISGSGDSLGLFGTAGKSSGTPQDNALLSNIVLTDASITAQGTTPGAAGALAGSIRSVPGTTGSAVLNCHSSVSIITNDNYTAGGLIGINHGATLSNSFVTGTVHSQATAGGLIGQNNSPGSIIDCYSTAVVVAGMQAGGLVGDNSGTIMRAYAAGSVSGTVVTGGLIGANTGTVTDSFYDLCTTGQSDSGSGLGLYTADMMKTDTYSGWNSPPWILQNDSYPYLDWQTINVPVVPIKNTLTLTADEGGSVTGAGNYYCGEQVTVTAVADPGYVFVAWLEEDAQVSTSAEYMFRLTTDRQLTASFDVLSPPPPGPPTPPDDDDEATFDVPADIEVTVDFDQGRLTVIVPPGTLTNDGLLRIRQIPDTQWPQAGLSTILYAVYQVLLEQDGEYVRNFDRPLTLEISFEPEDVHNLSSGKLHIFYYDEYLQRWIALPTDIDFRTNMARATTRHLTQIALMYDPDFPVLTDITQHWARQYVLSMASLDVVDGYPDHTFRPEQPVTRAEFARMIVESLGLQTVPGELSFTDTVPEWAVPYVHTAVQSGLFTGYDDDSFRPQDHITREQMAAVLVRAVSTDITEQAVLSNNMDVSPWAKAYVQTAVDLGLLMGYPDGTFRGTALTTRAEACTVLWRLIRR